MMKSSQDQRTVVNGLAVAKGIVNETAYLNLLYELADGLAQDQDLNLALPIETALANIVAASEDSNISQRARLLLQKIAPPHQRYNVVVASLPTQASALKRARDINKQMRENRTSIEATALAPGIVAPSICAVTIGTNIALTEAAELRSKAITAGLPEDTYLAIVWQRH